MKSTPQTDHRSAAGRTASHAAVLFALLAGLSACQRPADDPSLRAGAPSFGAAAAQPLPADARATPTPAALVMAQVDLDDKVRDVALSAEVSAELSHIPALRGLPIDVDTVGGHVALRGAAPDHATRELAGMRAARVPGVRSIDNQLFVGGGPG